MSDPMPTYRNAVLRLATDEGCPAEVTKEAIEEALMRPRPAGDDPRYTTREVEDAVAYAYTAGRVARWDALIKGSPRLMDAILAVVHEFFHDEPWPGHAGIALECPDCPTVAALAADAATAFWSAEETAEIMADPELVRQLAEAEADLDDDVPFNVVKSDILRHAPIDSLLHSGAATPEEDPVEIIFAIEPDADDPTGPDFWRNADATRQLPTVGKFDEGEFRVATDGEVRHG